MILTMQSTNEPKTVQEKAFFKNEVDMTPEQSWRCAAITVDQSKNNTWRNERSKRPTSTKALALINAYEKFKKNKLDYKTLILKFRPKPIKRGKSPAIDYGNDFEHLAKKNFSDVTGHHVFDIGLVCKNRFSWFGGSPDGLFQLGNGLHGLLEIKCAYKYRNEDKIDIKGLKYMTKEGNMNEKHAYYMQLQLNCWVTGSKFAYLFIYTENDHKLIPVSVDDGFA